MSQTTKISLIISFCLVAGMILTSCKKYLDVKSNSGLTTPNSVESLQKLLDYASYINCKMNAYGAVADDDYFITDAQFSTFSDTRKKEYTWSNYEYINSTDWGDSYVSVYTANLVLDMISGMRRTEANKNDWDNVYGSALFYRSNSFLMLLWTYAKAYNKSSAASDLGIILRLTSNPDVKSERKSVDECYSKIIEDLKESVSYLPATADHVMRPSKAAAYGLLARTFLSMREYQLAKTYADSALSIHDQILDYNNSADVQVNSSAPFKRYNPETFFYSELGRSVNYGLVDTSLIKTYENEDLRKVAFFKKGTNGYSNMKGNYTGGTRQFNGLTTAEMLLINAECAARSGELIDALSSLNLLLEKRFKTGTFIPIEGLDQEQLISLVLNERRKELLFRGLRWMDIKRLNLEGRDITPQRKINGSLIQLPPNDNRFALPLPNYIIKLAGVPQNPV